MLTLFLFYDKYYIVYKIFYSKFIQGIEVVPYILYLYNIAQNQSFVQKGIGVKYRIPGSGIPFKS